MILVTGAAGKTGKEIIRVLIKKGAIICALVHNESQIQRVKELGVKEVLTGDMRSQERMDQVFQGVRAVYHIPPNISPEEFHIGQIAIKAAQSAGVEHFVYHSVLHPQVESMPHHWEKMRVEYKMFESGLPYTILQPAAYMQNILAYWDDIVQKGRYALPYSENTLLSYVDLEDVAEVAAIVLNDPRHMGAIYELCGSEKLSALETARFISSHLGMEVEVCVMPIERWEFQARRKGVGDYQINTLIKMFEYYDRFGFTGNSTIMECLLNRPPTSFSAFIERTIRERF